MRHSGYHASHSGEFFLLLQFEKEFFLFLELFVAQSFGPSQYREHNEEQDQGCDKGKGDDQAFEVEHGQIVFGDVLFEFQNAHDRISINVCQAAFCSEGVVCPERHAARFEVEHEQGCDFGNACQNFRTEVLRLPGLGDFEDGIAGLADLFLVHGVDNRSLGVVYTQGGDVETVDSGSDDPVHGLVLILVTQLDLSEFDHGGDNET